MTKYVLGLDVSMNSTGWAVLKVTSHKNVRLVDSGIIKANVKKSHGYRLRQKRLQLIDVLGLYPIDYVAKEAGFSRFKKATQVLFKAYGVVEELLSGDHEDYAATTIKKHVAGSGKATKEELEAAIRKSLKLTKNHEFASDDETDAIGVALTLIITKSLNKK